LFLPTAHIVAVLNPLDSEVILPVDLGNLHIPFSFIRETVIAKMVVTVKGYIDGNKTFVIVKLVVILPAGGLVIPSVSLSVVPVARLCLDSSDHSNGKQ
jgi:hypothetical protein